MTEYVSWPHIHEFSFWALMADLFEAKRQYYVLGNPKLADYEYDQLEQGIIAIHGRERFDEWYCVGYAAERHEIVKQHRDRLQVEYLDWYNNRKWKEKSK